MNQGRPNYKQENKSYARENRKNLTKSEGLVWHMILKNKNLGVKFVRQRMIGNYIVDFYSKELNLVIEIDGESHNYKFSYDQKRKKYLDGLGVKVLVYTDEQVLSNLEGVFKSIGSYVSENTPNYIRTTSPQGKNI
ncbi:MAG TPA: endonuclease domain-containing protein [Candidatus Absconditabacterales bacterium]|nr:endonuclease domain-containing protein [Candidatus Absconditabacterales bacterium]